MTSDRDQDIYATKRAKRPSSSPDTSLIDTDRFWRTEMRRSRRVTIFFTLLVVVCLVGLGSFTYLQYQSTLESLAEANGEVDVVGYKPTLPQLDLNMDAIFVIDELSEIEAVPLENLENDRKDLRWLKQAAFYTVQAEKAERDGLLDDALTYYGNVIQLAPELIGTHRRLGLIRLRLKDYEGALKSFELEQTRSGLTHGLANNLGVAHMGLENREEAEDYFLKAIELRDTYAPAQLNLATLYRRSKDYEKAAPRYRRYLLLEPDEPNASQAYAAVLVELERWDQAIDVLNRISKSAPDVAPIHFNLARALCHQERFEDALTSLERATSLVDPKQALAWMSRHDFDALRSHSRFQDLIDELASVSR